MAIATDFSINTQGDIRWVGTTSTYSVLELHRLLQDLADDTSAAGDDLIDITSPNPSLRRTDQIIELQGTYNIDDTAAEHLYGGSISQLNGSGFYSGLKVIGSVNNQTTNLQIVQNNTLLSNHWGSGINNSEAGTLLRVLVKTTENGDDIDGKRIRVQAREMGDTFAYFNVTLGQGEATAAIFTSSDDFNETDNATISGYSDITNTEGYQTIDLNNGNGARPYYSQWDIGARTLNDFYERAKYITRRGSEVDIYGMNGELFLGITTAINYSGETSGPFTENEVLTIGDSTFALLGLKDNGSSGVLYTQLLTGSTPTQSTLISGNTSNALGYVQSTSTFTPPNVFVGSYAGSLNGAYGVGMDPNDVTNNDTLRDLDNISQSPPNNVTYIVGGLDVGEDYTLVGPANLAENDIDLDQLTIAAGNSSGNANFLVDETIPSDTPSAGTIRVYNGNSYTKLNYTAYTGSTFTISGNLPQDFSDGSGCFISYIDKLATATSESFTVVYDSDRTLYIKVRDGGATPKQEFASPGTLTSAGGSITAIGGDDF